MISCTLRVTNIGDGNGAVALIYVNGANHAIGSMTGASAGEDPTITATSLAYVVAGQYIEMYTDASTTLTGTAGSTNTHMSIYFVGV